MATPIRSQPAFVLHKQLFETGQEQVFLLTPDLGRIDIRCRLETHSMPLFQQLDIDFRGQGARHQLRSWVASGPVHFLRDEWLYFGLYLNELITRLWPKQGGSTALFGLYSSTLTLISTQHQAVAGIRYFERTLLAEMGFAVEFSTCLAGKPIDELCCYQHCVGEGFRRVPQEQGPIPGALLIAIHHNHWHIPGALHFARQIFSNEIDLHLDGRTLHTRQLLRRYFQAKESTVGVLK